MQSSGATSFTLFLAQRPDCLALVDIANGFAAPDVAPTRDMVAKAVITTRYPLTVHRDRFRPGRSILFLRDPRDNYASLATKNYRDSSGLMDEKFALLEEAFAERDRYDAVIHYEDFVARRPWVIEAVNRLGWPVEESYYAYRRRHEEIFADLWQHLPHLFQEMELVFGNVRGKEVSQRHRNQPWTPDIEAHLARLCPRLLAHYQERMAHGV
jgi:hypothetical protein